MANCGFFFRKGLCMVPRKLNVMIARYPYAGNGGYASEIPDIGDWLVETILEMKSDPRIGEVIPWRKADTPISMVRNESVLVAKANGADLLLMIDSDNVPDYELKRGDKTAKPFWKTAFDFLYNHYDKGPAVIAAPYCGPPPHENVYVFQITNRESEHANPDFEVAQYSRHEAADRTGIEQVAALPTGLILFDVRAFDILPPPWFYYEWTNKFESNKASTEDVTATRDMMFHVHDALGYLPLYVAWDCWAGHVKPKVVGKPQIITADQVSKKLVEAARRGQNSKERTVVVNALDKFLASGAKMHSGLQASDHAQKSPPSSTGDESWQTPLWMLEQFGYTPQKDLLALRRLVKELSQRLGREPLVVELGTYIGQSAKAMAEAGARVVTIDNLQGSQHDSTLVQYAINGTEIDRARNENIGKFGGSQISCIIGDSVEVGQQWNKPIDMIYVDANHDYEPTRNDIQAWLPHVREGGIIAGHDYDAQFPGVIRAVTELFPEGVNVEGQVWWTVKKSAPVNRLTPLSYPEFEEDVPEAITNGYAR